jgi:CRP-like cAMP-binding protein
MTRLLPNGEENLFHIGEPGFWFGQLALLTSEKTAVAVIADTDVRLMMLTKAQSDRIGADHPLYFKYLALLVAQRYAALLRTMSYARLMTPEERVRARLAEIVAVQHSGQPAGGAVMLNLSQADLAAITGVSRQTLNEVLKQLKEEGLIEIAFRKIRVLDSSRLWNEST